MNQPESHDIAIVGGGLVGSLLATYLARRDLRVQVYERNPDLRGAEAGSGRSINLVLTSRGIEALDRVGMREDVLALTVPVTGRMMHDLAGNRSYQPYGRDDSECNYSVSRNGLNQFLVSRAEREGVAFSFRHALKDADLNARRLSFQTPEGVLDVTSPRIIGSDGAASVLRAAMVRLPGYEESVRMLGHDYKELTIPVEQGRTLELRALHIWPRGEIMLMALPNLDGSFTVTLYLPSQGPNSFESIDSEASVVEFFQRYFPDSIPLIPDLAPSFLANPVGELGTVRCAPWHHRDTAFVIGDAAHAIVPFFGQGMNCGFEDCLVLDRLIDEHGIDHWGDVLPEFSRDRKPNADAIADMALDNFVEMRDRVGDDRFLLRKQLEHRLEQELPQLYRSRYSMVMYSSIPYAVAEQAGRVQQELLEELLQDVDDVAECDLSRATELIDQRLTPLLRRHDVSLDY